MDSNITGVVSYQRKLWQRRFTEGHLILMIRPKFINSIQRGLFIVVQSHTGHCPSVQVYISRMIALEWDSASFEDLGQTATAQRGQTGHPTGQSGAQSWGPPVVNQVSRLGRWFCRRDAVLCTYIPCILGILVGWTILD